MDLDISCFIFINNDYWFLSCFRNIHSIEKVRCILGAGHQQWETGIHKFLYFVLKDIIWISKLKFEICGFHSPIVRYPLRGWFMIFFLPILWAKKHHLTDFYRNCIVQILPRTKKDIYHMSFTFLDISILLF